MTNPLCPTQLYEKLERERLKNEIAVKALMDICHECEISVTPDNIIWEFAKDAIKAMEKEKGQ